MALVTPPIGDGYLDAFAPAFERGILREWPRGCCVIEPLESEGGLTSGVFKGPYTSIDFGERPIAFRHGEIAALLGRCDGCKRIHYACANDASDESLEDLSRVRAARSCPLCGPVRVDTECVFYSVGDAAGEGGCEPEEIRAARDSVKADVCVCVAKKGDAAPAKLSDLCFSTINKAEPVAAAAIDKAEPTADVCVCIAKKGDAAPAKLSNLCSAAIRAGGLEAEDDDEVVPDSNAEDEVAATDSDDDNEVVPDSNAEDDDTTLRPDDDDDDAALEAADAKVFSADYDASMAAMAASLALGRAREVRASARALYRSRGMASAPFDADEYGVESGTMLERRAERAARVRLEAEKRREAARSRKRPRAGEPGSA